MEVSQNVKNAYSNQYDDSMVEWRTKAAKYKAKNIVDLASLVKFNSVLEVGSGEGSILYWLSLWNFSNDLNGLEISESGIELTKDKGIKNLNKIDLFNGYEIPYEKDSFDLIICSHVIEHVENPRILLREIKRVSKYQIFEVPIDFTFYVDKKVKHFLSYGHINIFTPGLFRFLLFSEKFEMIKDKCYLYDDEIIKHLFKDNLTGFYKLKMKHIILKTFPYLLGIKPSSYAILTSKSEEVFTVLH